MYVRAFSALLTALAATPALAAPSGLDLGDYSLTATHALPAVAASEASAVTWNWDSNTLFVLGDEGDALVEVDLLGNQLSVMTLTGFDDTEGVAYVGNGQFVITEERLQDAYLLDYSAAGSAARSSLASSSLGPTVGNIGIEGIAYDPLTGGFVAVKEKSPQAVYAVTLNYGGDAAVTSLFSPDLGVLDLSDVQVLSGVLAGTADQDNLLVFSQESAMLLEISRTGQILSSLSLAGVADNIEGVTMDSLGNIYLVGENPSLYVLSAPVPEPETYALMLAGLGLVGFMARRRRSA
ncbi:MAG: SdiA-regulated domain-containing protein [Pseudomonadota bacterium]